MSTEDFLVITAFADLREAHVKAASRSPGAVVTMRPVLCGLSPSKLR